MLEIIGLDGFFQAVVTSTEAPGKPDPSVFLIAASHLGVEPISCLVIEDSPSGIEAAKRAGMPVIAVCNTHPAEKLSGANIVLPGLDQIGADHL